MTTMYPRFLGVDGSGDFVWELADGQWTFGDDPHSAAHRERTFEPVRYIEKYGRPIGLDETIDRKAEAEQDPAELVKLYEPKPDTSLAPVPRAEAVRQPGEDPEMTGARQALSLMLNVLDGWIEGAQDNHVGMGHRHENRGDECWRSFAPSDIRIMVSDAARELGLAEFPAPAKPKEDEVR